MIEPGAAKDTDQFEHVAGVDIIEGEMYISSCRPNNVAPIKTKSVQLFKDSFVMPVDTLFYFSHSLNCGLISVRKGHE